MSSKQNSVSLMTQINAARAAMKSLAPQACDAVYSVPLSSITKTWNPRSEPSNLAIIGYKLIDCNDTDHSLLHMGLSDDIEINRALVSLFEEHENSVVTQENQGNTKVKNDLSNLDTDFKDQGVKHSIVAMAYSIVHKQLQPVSIRRIGKNSDDYTCILVFGQRRTAAMLYAYVKSKLNKIDGIKDSPFNNIMPVILANEVKCTEDEAYDWAVQENLARKDFTAVQKGLMIARYLERTNPKTNKKWNLKDVAAHLYPDDSNKKYNSVRNWYSLVEPYVPDEVDKDGNVIKGRGLTPEQRIAIEKGNKTPSWGYKQSMRMHIVTSDQPDGTKRKRPISLKDIQTLFDATDMTNVVRRQALADCMGISLEQATQESDERIAVADAKSIRDSIGNKHLGDQVNL